MHDCPECGSICYCDLDDSNDCRDRDDGGVLECFHGCEPEEDFDDDWASAACPGCGEPVNLGGETCGAAECGGKRLPGAADESAPSPPSGEGDTDGKETP